MKKIKMYCKTFFAKTKKKFNDFWFKYVTKPKIARKEKNDKELELKILHKNFEQRFGVSSIAVKEQMAKLDNSYKKLEQTDTSYLNDRLVEGRVHMNQACYTAPNFFDPEVVNIHNEYFANTSGPTISEVMAEHNREGKEMLRKQEDKIRFNNLPEAKKEKLKRILRAR